MLATDTAEQTIEQQTAVSLQRPWPQLGRELLAMEYALTSTVGTNEKPLTIKERTEKRDRIRETIIAQLYRDEESHSLDTRYRALLFVENGRAGGIVGNPYYTGKGSKKLELPYTGLEGYYAGSTMTEAHPGLTPAEIVQEEANIGVELLGNIKKQSIDHYSWASFAKMKRVLDGGEADLENLRRIGLLWSKVVRRLHVRVYSNQEFESTLSEQIEQAEKLLGTTPARTREEKKFKDKLQAEYERLKKERNNLSEAEKEREKGERRRRERIRRERLQEFKTFREETYSILKEAQDCKYDISVRDSSWKEANIIEMISLPKTYDRNYYTPYEVKLTPKQLEGYLFLAKLGEIGGDPLTRSALLSDS